MKRFAVLLLLLLLIGTMSMFAAPSRSGLGVGLSTGLPFHIGPAVEYDFGPAYAALELGYMSLVGTDFFMLKMGGGYNFPTPFIQNDWSVDLYLSVGGNFGLYFMKGFTLFSMDIPVTWTWYMDDIPMKFYVQAGPLLTFSGGFNALFTGSIGAMYQFDL